MAEQRTVAQIEQEIADLKQRWPAHTVPARMIEQMEDLEDELAAAKARETAANA